MMRFISLALCLCIPTSMAAAVQPDPGGDALEVVSYAPELHRIDAPASSPISVEFNIAVDPASFDADSFHVFGRWTGTIDGTLSFSKDGRTVTLVPDEILASGDMISVQLSHDIQALNGSNLRDAGYFFQFWTAVASTPLPELVEIADMTTRREGESTSRSYGGIGSDLNNDGWLDITVVNEDSADLRVFLNTADGTGLMHEFLEPTFPVEDRASPSEPADFNRDGNVDICVCNINTNSVSILLGNGDGTFAPGQIVNVGSAPRGIAVLDVDGDGDTDIVNTNFGSGNCSLLLNNGSGTFGNASFFNAGVSGEWSLMAADMNEDGINDLVVGGRSSNNARVLTSNGDGTFNQMPAQSIGGSTWVIALGDVNGDGHVDISSANSSQNNGGIVTGNGDGTLNPAVTFASDFFPLSTDLGDIDGDGDLDWMISCFSGDFWLYLNDGTGTFAFYQEFDAPAAASCALFLDLDNDSDMDMALIDELADRLFLIENTATPTTPGDLDGNGTIDVDDLLALLGAWGPCNDPCPPTCTADLNDDCSVGVDDLLTLLANWG